MSDRLGALAPLGAFLGGSLLVMLVGGPSWLAIGYAAVGAAVTAARLRRRAVTAAPAEPPPEPAPSEERGAVEAPADRPASALGYVLVSRTPGEDGEYAGEAIRAVCASRRLKLRRIVRDVEAAPGDAQARSALRWALDQLAQDEAQTLVVAKLGHITDTAAGLPELLRWLSARNLRLIVIDVPLDTASEAGGLTVGAIAQVGGWERDRISQHTRHGPETARSRGASRGRPSVADVPELRERIVAMRRDGMTLQAIADTLNEEGVPTLRGGAKWRPSSVQSATGYRRPSAAGRRRVPPEEQPVDRTALSD
jgi:DNA invertase Pin-like site-specific DNA recombinase